MIKDRKSFFFFSSSSSVPLLSHLSHHSLLLSSPLTPYIIFFSSVSICQLNLDGRTCSHTHTHTYSYAKRSHPYTHLRSRSNPPSLVRFGGIAAFFFILKDLGSGDAVMSSSVSAEPSRPGRLDYISALVRPGDVFTRIINFISCPSIHPYVQLQLYP